MVSHNWCDVCICSVCYTSYWNTRYINPSVPPGCLMMFLLNVTKPHHINHIEQQLLTENGYYDMEKDILKELEYHNSYG